MSDKRNSDLDPVAEFEGGFGVDGPPINGTPVREPAAVRMPIAPPAAAAPPPAPEPPERPETRAVGRRPAPPPEPTPPEEQPEELVDDLEKIINHPTMPIPMKIMAHRLLGMENQKIAQMLIGIETRLRRVEPIVQQLSSQRSVAEDQMERHTRFSALDLAIKALPEADRNPDMITTYASAFMAYMKANLN